MKKLLTFSVVAVMAVGVYSTVNSVRDQRSDLMSQNIEALSAGEQSGYRNARNQFCAIPNGAQGCVEAALRSCPNSVFCIR